MTPDPHNPAPEPRPPDPGGLEAVAADWIRRRDEGLAPAERTEFRAWLARDPRHARALARADLKADEFDWPWHTGTIDLVAAGLEARARRRRWRRRAATAGSLAAVAAAGLFWRWRQAPADALPSASHTVVSLPARQTLSDGSVVELKDGARITVAFTAALRRVVLASGSAYFTVAKNRARPFLVEAAGVEVQAVGTAFAVQLGREAVEVLVTEGRVAVAQPAVPSEGLDRSRDSVAERRRVFVDAGSAVAMPVSPAADPDVRVRAVPVAELGEKLDWREPRLRFAGTPLSEVVAMMNRYNHLQLIIGDPSVAEVRLSGVLRADKVDALVQLLESDFAVSAERQGDAEIILRKAP